MALECLLFLLRNVGLSYQLTQKMNECLDDTKAFIHVSRRPVLQNIQTNGCRFFPHPSEKNTPATVFWSNDTKRNHSRCPCGCMVRKSNCISSDYDSFCIPSDVLEKKRPDVFIFSSKRSVCVRRGLRRAG